MMQRRYTKQKPAAAGIISIVGGSMDILGSLAIIGFARQHGLSTTAGIVGLFLSAIVIPGGILLLLDSRHHQGWGALVLIFSIFSAPFNFFGGLVIGFLLGLIGSILGIIWKPEYMKIAETVSFPPMRACPKCGFVISSDSKFCSHCGNQFGETSSPPAFPLG